MTSRILAYHSIGSEGSGEVGSELYCVREDEFRAQMRVVAMLRGTLKCGSIPTGDVGRGTYVLRPTSKWVQQRNVLRNVLTITFDDGLLNNYTTAYPILREYGLTAYFFILVGKVGKNGYMSWEQIKELRKAGMTIGSHGITHRILTGMSAKDLDYELEDSKKVLEKNLDCEIDCLSIPRGFCSKRIIDKAKKIGYKTIFTSRNRIPVKANWSVKKFEDVLNNGHSLRDKGVELLKTASKKILGPCGYDKLRTKILT